MRFLSVISLTTSLTKSPVTAPFVITPALQFAKHAHGLLRILHTNYFSRKGIEYYLFTKHINELAPLRVHPSRLTIP